MTDQLPSHVKAAQQLQKGQAAVHAGRLSEAQRCLREATHLDPHNEVAWLWRAAVAPTPQETLPLLQHVLTLNPQNRRARAGLAAVRKQLGLSSPEPAPPARPHRLRDTLPPREPMAQTQQTARSTPDIAAPEHTPAGNSIETIRVAQRELVQSGEKTDPRSHAGLFGTRFRRLLFALLFTAIIGFILLLLLSTGIVPARATWWLKSPSVAPLPVLASAQTTAVPQDFPPKKEKSVPNPLPTPSRGERTALLLDQLVEPWEAGDWPRVLNLIHRSGVEQESLAREKSFAAQMNWALKLVEQNRLQEAIPHFTAALAIRPDDVRASGERQKAQAYLSGQQAITRKNWSVAIEALHRVIVVDAHYLDVAHLLGEAYWQRGQSHESAGKLSAAAADYGQALAIQPSRQEVRNALAHVNWLLTPPTPTPTITPIPGPEKWIDVDLSEQRLRAYEGNKVVLNVLVSTGLPRTPTVVGTFHIWTKLLKADMVGGSPALNNYYNLKNVPYIMYFYKDYGLHGTYWHTNFGHPMSHGCVNLRTADAKWLFNWAGPKMPNGKTTVYSSAKNPGTRVVIHP